MIQSVDILPFRTDFAPSELKRNSNSELESSEFKQLLTSAIQGVKESQATADTAVLTSLMGDSSKIPEAIIAMEETSLKFQMLLEVRNRIIDTYQEISRMQI